MTEVSLRRPTDGGCAETTVRYYLAVEHSPHARHTVRAKVPYLEVPYLAVPRYLKVSKLR